MNPTGTKLTSRTRRRVGAAADWACLLLALAGGGGCDSATAAPETAACPQHFSDRAIFPSGTLHLDYTWEDQRYETDLTATLLGPTQNSFHLRGCSRAPTGTVWDFRSFWFDLGPDYPYEFDLHEKRNWEPKLEAKLFLCDVGPCFGGQRLIEIRPVYLDHTLQGKVLDYSATAAFLKAEFTAVNTSPFQPGQLVLTIDLAWDPNQPKGVPPQTR